MYKYIFIVAILVNFTPVTAKAEDCPSRHSDREAKSLLVNGYCDKYGYYYPSMITPESAQRSLPDFAEGNVTWVNPNRMEDTAVVNNIDLAPFVDGIALMSCSDVGETVWVKRPDRDWEGPFVVADCANPKHMFAAICYKEEIAELGFKTAVSWGLASYENNKVKVIKHIVENVLVTKEKKETDHTPINYRNWWLSKLKFLNGETFSEMNFEC